MTIVGFRILRDNRRPLEIHPQNLTRMVSNQSAWELTLSDDYDDQICFFDILSKKQRIPPHMGRGSSGRTPRPSPLPLTLPSSPLLPPVKITASCGSPAVAWILFSQTWLAQAVPHPSSTSSTSPRDRSLWVPDGDPTRHHRGVAI